MDHVVVVGAGLAGVSAAETLRALGYGGTITMLSAEDRLPYDRPPLSKAALLDDPAPPDALLRPEGFYPDHAITLRLGTTVTRLVPSEGRVELAGGTRVRADAVLLCTGGEPRTLGLPGAGLDGVCTLRSAEDAARIRARLEARAPVAVIGGGFIGSEVAAAAVTRGCPTTILEAAELPMLRALGRDVAERVVREHRARGVEVRTGAVVAGFTGTDAVAGVALADGSEVPAELVVVGVGMAPRDGLAAAAGLEVGDGVHADATGRTSHPAVFAAGDAASVPAPGGERRRCEHWQGARDQGVGVAHALLGRAAPAGVPWFWSDQYDLNIQVAGSPSPRDTRTWRGGPDARSFAVLHHRDGVLTGITAVNRGKEVRPAMELIRRAAVLGRDALADPDTTMKSLLKAVR